MIYVNTSLLQSFMSRTNSPILLELEIYNIIFLENKFSIWSCATIKSQKFDFLYILNNTINTYKYKTCIVQCLLCLEVLFLVLLT